MKRRLLNLILLIVMILILRTSGAAAPTEPGPEDGGLRLRLAVAPRIDSGKQGYDVHLDLLNTSGRAMRLLAAWRNEEDNGDVKDYIEAAMSIECVPAVAPWIGGVREGRRTAPQPEYVLKAGEVLSVSWRTEGRRLKNRVTNPNNVQNPEFAFPGLYSVHAMVDVVTSEGTVRLRSNEQLVAVGGRHTMPKYTFGRLWHVNEEKKTATLDLGSLHKIEPGDQFQIGHPKGGHWRLTINRVEPESSVGTLEVLTRTTYPTYPSLPNRFMEATLIREK